MTRVKTERDNAHLRGGLVGANKLRRVASLFKMVISLRPVTWSRPVIKSARMKITTLEMSRFLMAIKLFSPPCKPFRVSRKVSKLYNAAVETFVKKSPNAANIAMIERVSHYELSQLTPFRAQKLLSIGTFESTCVVNFIE